MGVDASLFARKAKMYVDVDRHLNLHLFFYLDEYEKSVGEKEIEFLNEIWDGLTHQKSMGYDELKYLLESNIKVGEMENKYANHKYWNQVALKFIEKYPNDEYFLVSDHEEPSHYDYMKKYSEPRYYNSDALPKEDRNAYEEESYQLLFPHIATGD